MTTRALYENILFELRKSKAPHIHIEEFLYFSNKGVQEFINTEYERFETTQKTSDALQNITDQASCIFNYTNNTVTISTNYLAPVTSSFITGNRYGSAFVQIATPSNYFHLTNCVPTLSSKFNFKCYNAGTQFTNGAKKWTADSAAGVFQNAWLKPNFKRPFYKEVDHLNVSGSTPAVNIITSPDLQIFYGDSSKFKVDEIYFEYLRIFKRINLTQDQIDAVSDTSDVLDFSEYICNEIIKRIVVLILENSRDAQRIQTFIPTNKSIT